MAEHIIVEDYKNYRKRRDYKDKSNFAIFLIIVFVVIGGIVYFSNISLDADGFKIEEPVESNAPTTSNSDTKNTQKEIKIELHCGMSIEDFILIAGEPNLNEYSKAFDSTTLEYYYENSDRADRVDFVRLKNGELGLNAIWQDTKEGIKKQVSDRERIFGCGYIDGNLERVV